ncbi:MAG: RES domain-containing protein [Terracidiphilus sp.]|jgi:RES domain-containing protein
MDVFRMHGTAYGVFDTTGAFQYPGRWHSRGTRVVYAAEHASLAVLETLIHAGGRKIPLRALTRIHIPDGVPIESQPWMELPTSQAFGDAWVREARTAVLRVPSIAVNRLESNFVLNPRHPDFPQIQHDPPAEFAFDPRFIPTR